MTLKLKFRDAGASRFCPFYEQELTETHEAAKARRRDLQPRPDDDVPLAEHFRRQRIELAPRAGFYDNAHSAMQRFKAASAARWS